MGVEGVEEEENNHEDMENVGHVANGEEAVLNLSEIASIATSLFFLIVACCCCCFRCIYQHRLSPRGKPEISPPADVDVAVCDSFGSDLPQCSVEHPSHLPEVVLQVPQP